MIDSKLITEKRHRGYYSLVQFCPDAARLEVANIGVVVFSEAQRYFGVKVSSDNQRISQMFGRGKRDLGRLRISKHAFEERLLDECRTPKHIEDLKKLAVLQVNHIRMTDFMPCRLTNNPEDDLNMLFSELVNVKVRKTDRQISKNELVGTLEREFSAPALTPLVQRDISVTIPVFRRETTVPFAYQNGRLNLINPVVFPKSESALENRAALFAVEGQSIYSNPDRVHGELQLLIVGSFRGNDSGHIEMATNILKEHNVRFYRNDQIGELVDEIKTHGHQC